MHNILLTISFFLAVTSFGQRVIDTTEIYNGKLTSKKVEYSSENNILKEVYNYSTGQKQIEYFFKDGKKVRWVSYDLNGIQTSEWNDPEIGYAEHRKLRNTIFSLTLICIVALIVAASKLSYVKTYYSLLCLSVIYPFVIFLSERIIPKDEEHKILQLIFASTLFILPSLLLILSVVNFLKKRQVSLVTSIFAILVSISFLLFFIATTLVAGAGMLG